MIWLNLPQIKVINLRTYKKINADVSTIYLFMIKKEKNIKDFINDFD